MTNAALRVICVMLSTLHKQVRKGSVYWDSCSVGTQRAVCSQSQCRGERAAEEDTRVSAMPVTTRQGGDGGRSGHSSPRCLSHCVLDIMESEEYVPSSPSSSYWSHLGEFVSRTRHKEC